MTEAELEAVVQGITDAVLGHVRGEIATVLAKLAQVETKALATGRDGRDGQDGAAGAPGAEGKAGEPGKDGRDGINGKDGAPGLDGKAGQDGAAGRDGIDGKDAPPVTAEQLSEAVKAYLDANPIPAGRDGKDGLDGKAGSPGVDGRDGRDGVGLAGALIDRAGELVLTLSDGATKALGPVVGAKGEPGQDGRDGFGFDDLEATYDGDRTIALTFTKGDQVKAFAFELPIPVYRGVFEETKTYKAGEVVTWGGSMWVAKEPTSAKPGTGIEAKAWQLAVKRGGEGQRGKPGEMGPRGPAGPPRGTLP